VPRTPEKRQYQTTKSYKGGTGYGPGQKPGDRKNNSCKKINDQAESDDIGNIYEPKQIIVTMQQKKQGQQ
jgi:hypothetical protein